MQDPARASDAPSSLRAGSDPEGRDAARASRVFFFAATIFASAFLIFLVQPMVGKRILPWFGGAPAVWTLCLAFYQTTLFLGYAYAHLMIRFVPPRLQVAVHAVAVAGAIASLPVLPDAPLDELGTGDPTLTVLGLLTSRVAMPFLVLASTGPLVQAWFARAHPTWSPYPLYAVSNVGSFLALFIFPFILEPRLPLPTMGQLWSLGFAATALAVLVCAFFAARHADALGSATSPSESRGSEARDIAGPLLWIGLSGSAVIVLMGVTNKLCLDVASIPFLWIVPLATYLLTFILCFSSEGAYRRFPSVTAAIVAFAITRFVGPTELIAYQVLAYCVLLFSACMCLHGELYRSRPAARSLTRFYLYVSAGGALGGLLAGIAAPLVFDDYYELQMGLVLASVVLIVVCARDRSSWLRWDGLRGRWRLIGPLLVAGAVLASWHELRTDPQIIHKERSFFGVLTVREIADDTGGHRTLASGTTMHGLQFRGDDLRRLPTSYFGRATGLGLALASWRDKSPARIGVIGLGVGTLAAYGRRGDTMRFYEIDPVVLKLAGPGGYFSFVEDSRAAVEFVLGDARLSIESEQKSGEPQNFDILVLDAFSSDAIPIHLMTREAFAGYFDALAPGGLMAVHVSSRHFYLMNLASRLADEFGAYSLQVKTRPAPGLQSGLSDWVMITRDADRLIRLEMKIEQRHRAMGLMPQAILLRRGKEANLAAFPLWTDDYSDLLRVVRW